MGSSLDVMNALATKLVAATASVGKLRTVYKGWPSRNGLLKHMQEGTTDITVYLPPSMERQLQPYPPIPFQVTALTVDLFVDAIANKSALKRAADGETVSFTLGSTVGTGDLVVGENVALKVKRYEVLTTDYVVRHTIGAGDSLLTVVAGLVSSLNALALDGIVAVVNPPASASFDITFTPTGGNIRKREAFELTVGGKSQWAIETRRQSRAFWINIWAPSQTLRDTFSDAIDSYVGLFEDAALPGKFNLLALPDGTAANIYYTNSFISDEEQAQKVWRKTYVLTAEYATIKTVTGYEIVATKPTLTISQPPGTTARLGNFENCDVIDSGYILPCWYDPVLHDLFEDVTIFATK